MSFIVPASEYPDKVEEHPFRWATSCLTAQAVVGPFTRTVWVDGINFRADTIASADADPAFFAITHSAGVSVKGSVTSVGGKITINASAQSHSTFSVSINPNANKISPGCVLVFKLANPAGVSRVTGNVRLRSRE